MITINGWKKKESHDPEDFVSTAQREDDAVTAAKMLLETEDTVEVLNNGKLIYSSTYNPKDPEHPIVVDNRTPPILDIPSLIQDDDDQTDSLSPNLQ